MRVGDAQMQSSGPESVSRRYLLGATLAGLVALALRPPAKGAEPLPLVRLEKPEDLEGLVLVLEDERGRDLASVQPQLVRVWGKGRQVRFHFPPGAATGVALSLRIEDRAGWRRRVVKREALGGAFKIGPDDSLTARFLLAQGRG